MSHTPFSSITIIYNPNSTGPSQTMAETLAHRLKDYPARVSLYGSERPGHAEELAETAASNGGAAPLVISSSGDGGYHEVVNGVMKANNLHGHQAAAAVLPGGNGNDHRRAIARGTLAEGILNHRVAHIDLIKVTVTKPDGTSWTRYAHSYVGLGLTPLVATELNHHDLNRFIEIVIVLKALSKLRPVTIRAEDQLQTLDSLILANVKETGKTLTLTETGGPRDGLFEVIAFPAASKLKLVSRLLTAVLRGLKPDRRLSNYAFETIDDTLMQIDGEVSELAPGTHISVVSLPRILKTVL